MALREIRVSGDTSLMLGTKTGDRIFPLYGLGGAKGRIVSVKILYIASGPIPSIAANSVHVAHMAGAFAQQKDDVTVLAPSSFPFRVATAKSITKRYGVDGFFRLLSAWKPKIPAGSRIFLMVLGVVLRILKPDVVYSRDLLGACFAATKGYPAILRLTNRIGKGLLVGMSVFSV